MRQRRGAGGRRSATRERSAECSGGERQGGGDRIVHRIVHLIAFHRRMMVFVLVPRRLPPNDSPVRSMRILGSGAGSLARVRGLAATPTRSPSSTDPRRTYLDKGERVAGKDEEGRDDQEDGADSAPPESILRHVRASGTLSGVRQREKSAGL